MCHILSTVVLYTYLLYIIIARFCLVMSDLTKMTVWCCGGAELVWAAPLVNKQKYEVHHAHSSALQHVIGFILHFHRLFPSISLLF